MSSVHVLPSQPSDKSAMPCTSADVKMTTTDNTTQSLETKVVSTLPIKTYENTDLTMNARSEITTGNKKNSTEPPTVDTTPSYQDNTTTSRKMTRTSGPGMTPRQSDIYRQTQTLLETWVKSLTVIVGTVGNTLNLVVLSRGRLACSSSTVYLSALSGVDLLFLVSSSPGMLASWGAIGSEGFVRFFEAVRVPMYFLSG